MSNNHCPVCGHLLDGDQGIRIGRPATGRIRVLNVLMESKGNWLRTDQIAERVGMNKSTVHVHVHNIRKMLAEQQSDHYIDSMRGLGYCYKIRGDNG